MAKQPGGVGMPRVADDRVVRLEGVPEQGDRLRLAAGSNGGGGLEAFVGLYRKDSRGPGRTSGDPLGQHLSMPGVRWKARICVIRTEGSGLTRLVNCIEAGVPSWKLRIDL